MASQHPVQSFFAALDRRDVAAALATTSADATIEVVPLGCWGRMADEGRRFLQELHTAFPDLELRLKRWFVGRDGTAVAEVNMQGTQAADLFGIVNQEKHIDLDQAWTLHVGEDGRLDRVKIYWCQNQLLRRLAVKRLDRVRITA